MFPKRRLDPTHPSKLLVVKPLLLLLRSDCLLRHFVFDKAYRGCIRALELDTVVASSCSGVWALGHTLSYVVLKIL